VDPEDKVRRRNHFTVPELPWKKKKTFKQKLIEVVRKAIRVVRYL
jgi:hypothetical protein